MICESDVTCLWLIHQGNLSDLGLMSNLVTYYNKDYYDSDDNYDDDSYDDDVEDNNDEVPSIVFSFQLFL